MARALLVLTFLLVLPAIALAWPFAASEGQVAGGIGVANFYGGAMAVGILAGVALLGAFALRTGARSVGQLAPFARDYASYNTQFVLGAADVYKDYASAFLKGSSGIASALLGQGFGKLGAAVTGQVGGLEQNALDRWAARLEGLRLPGEKRLGEPGYFSGPPGRVEGRLLIEAGILAIPAPAIKGSGLVAKLGKHVVQVNEARSAARLVQVAIAALEVAPALAKQASNVAKAAAVAIRTSARTEPKAAKK